MGILVDPTKHFPSHPSEEVLEEYVFRRLPETLAGPVEEHLLVCHGCQDAVAETDDFVAALKVVANPWAPKPASQPGSWVSALRNLAHRTSLAPMVALVTLALVAVWKQPPETSALVAVSLSSLRGLSALAPAPAGKPLRLNIDVPDLVSPGKYRIEV